MNITEKTAYLKGLLEGLAIDASKPEGKLLSAIVDTLDAMAAEVADLKKENEEFAEYLDDVDYDLGQLESDYYDLDDDDEDYYDDDDDYCYCEDCDAEDCTGCELADDAEASEETGK